MAAKPTAAETGTNERQGTTTSTKRSRKKSKSSQVLMCIADCKYDVVREAAQAQGWKLINEDPEASTARKCHVYWIDVPAIVERTQHLQKWQRINHFPGMSNVARKGRLAQNLDRMRRAFPHEYSFYPRTWVLPVEWGSFKTEFDANGKTTRTFIVKPDSGCQGRGIFLTKNIERVDAMESQVAQIYVQKPLLIEGYKFDLRLYVLVTSVMPLRVYAFKDGLTRLCTEEYTRPSGDNLGKRCMHLTNYAVNKGSDNFVANDHADRDDLGSKRSLRWLLSWIAAERGGKEKADALWRKMGGAIIRTLISVLPTLHREYLHTFGPDKGPRRPQAPKGDGDNIAGSSSTNPCTINNVGSPPSTRASRTGVAFESSNDGGSVGSSSCGIEVTTAGDDVTDSSSDNLRERLWHVDSGDDGTQNHLPQQTQGHCLPTSSGEGEGIEDGCSKEKEYDEYDAEIPPSTETHEIEVPPPMEPQAEAAQETSTTLDEHRGAAEGGGGSSTEGCRIRAEKKKGEGMSGEPFVRPADRNCRKDSVVDKERNTSATPDTEGVVEGSRCVEILGFDFMIDAALKPWLIEVNHLPSFATDSPLDRRIKSKVVSTAMSVLHAKASDRKSYEDNAKRDAQNRLYNPEALAAGSAQREKERKEAEAAVAAIKKKMEAIYRRFAPHKLCKVDGLLVRYAGDEDRLLRIVRRKYVDTAREKENPAGKEGKLTSTPCENGGYDCGEQKCDGHNPSSTDAAPSHGCNSFRDVGQQSGGGSREELGDSNESNPTEGEASETPVSEKPSGGKHSVREGSPPSWPSPLDDRTSDQPHDAGRMRTSSKQEGSDSAVRDEGGHVSSRPLPAAPSSSSSSSLWATEQEDDLEALSREMEILDGWERLHPPPDEAVADQIQGKKSPTSMAGPESESIREYREQSRGSVGDQHGAGGGGGGGLDDGDVGGNGDEDEGGKNCDGGGRGGTAKGRRRKRKPHASVEVMIQRAFEDDRKMTLRLRCPLQQQRGGVMEPQMHPATKLPPVGAARSTPASASAATRTLASNQQENTNRSPPPVVLAPEQRERAQRLMEGYSSNSQRSASAPSGSAGAGTSQEERSTLPVSLRIAVVRAKEWRRRRDEGNARRKCGSVAVKVHTFDFGEFPAEGGHQA